MLEFTQGPYIFEAYYKAPAAFIGAAGTFMGFYNMAVRTRACAVATFNLVLEYLEVGPIRYV